ncbi:MAG: putative bifunctional diguanylate cyclase/phosphodiesterase, partial [Cyanobacteriota bacterium]|jgi:diguanylate cyclase (GGDEF)-like protein
VRRIERRGGQRIRRTCQELDQLLLHFGLPLSVSSGEERVLARLLRQPGGSTAPPPAPVPAPPLPPSPSLPILETAPDPTATDPAPLDRGGHDSSALEVGLRMKRLTDRFQQFLASARTLALCDPLTQLPNRRYFIEQLELESERHRELGKSFAILFVDVDRFKSINDTYGHAVGDGALVAVATRLRSLLRSGDFLARYGGDEFVIVMTFKREASEEVELRAEAHRFATQIAGEFQGTTEVDGVSLELSLSIGISLVDPLEADPQAAMKRSDIAMYRAKQHKFSRIAIFDVGDDGSQLDSYQLYVDLLKAVRQRELEVVFQPIVDGTGVMHAVEALVRWQHPTLGAVPPEQMLELAEQHRRMALLGDELLRLALEAYALLPPLDVPCLLSLNLSPSQLTDPGLVQRLTNQLHEHGIESRQVTLELTERSVLERSPLVEANLQALRGLGMRLSLDDFGTGYSSLNLLNTLQPDEVKIDQSFVMAMTTDSYARQIVSLIAGMAPLLGVELVAEGVETPACLAMLQEMGVKLYQGYLFSRPLPAPQLGRGTFAPPPRQPRDPQQASGRL